MKVWIGSLVVCGLTAAVAAGDAAYVDWDLQLVLPAELGGLSYERTEVYEKEAFGFSLFYAEGHMAAQVTLYTLGRTGIPDGPEGDGVDLVLESIGSGLQQQAEARQIANLRKRGRRVIPDEGEVRFASLVHQFVEPRVVEGLTNAVQRMHAAYVTGWNGRFIKAELTFDLLESDAGRAAADQMLKQLTEALQARPSEEKLLLASCDALILDPAGTGGRMAAQRVLAETQRHGNLNVYTHLFVWPDGYMKPKNADLLVAAYFAGMLKVVVPQQLKEGGEYEGFVAMLKAYEAMRGKGDITPIEQLDEWLKADDFQALFNQMLIDS